MENKNLFKNLITLMAFVFAGVFVYMAIDINSSNEAENSLENKEKNANQNMAENKKNKSWEELIPEIRNVIKKEMPDVIIETLYSLDIDEEADITGDDINEALIDLGSDAAHNDEFVLMMIENGNPVLSKFKQKNGKISALIFLSGTSVRNGEEVEILSDKKAIFAGHYNTDDFGEKIKNCEVEAYIWNSETKIFEYDSVLSSEIGKDECVRAKEMIEIDS